MNTLAAEIIAEPSSIATVIALAILPWLLIIVLAVVLALLLPKLQSYMMKVQPRTLDGTILTLAACFTFSQTYFAADDAYHYVSAGALYWLKYGFGFMGTAFITIKAFRYGLQPPAPTLTDSPKTDNLPPESANK